MLDAHNECGQIMRSVYMQVMPVSQIAGFRWVFSFVFLLLLLD